MPPLLTAFLVAALLGAGAVLAWRSSGPADARLDPFGPVRLFVLVYVALIGAGSVLLAASGESTGGGPMLAASGLVAFAAGAAAYTNRSRGREGPEAIGSPDPLPIRGRILVPGVLALIAVGVVGLAMTLVRSGVPFFSRDVIGSRLAVGGLDFDLFRLLVPPAALLLWTRALARRDRPLLLGAVAALAVLLLTYLALASRVLMLEVLLAAVLIAWWAGRRPRLRTWVLIGTFVAVGFVGIFVARVADQERFASPAEAVAFGLERTFSRVLLIQPRTLDIAVERIPAEEPFLLGVTYVRRLSTLTGIDLPRALGYRLYDRLFPTSPGGFAAPGVLSEAWANFGPLAFVLMAALGAGVAALGRFAARPGVAAVDRVLAAALTVACVRTYASTLNGFLIAVGLLVLWRIVASPPRLRR